MTSLTAQDVYLTRNRKEVTMDDLVLENGLLLAKIDRIVSTKTEGLSPIGEVVSLLIVVAKNQEERLKRLEQTKGG